MHEYEFRLVVCSSSPFLPLIRKLGYSTQKSLVLYAKPHFRLRNWRLETKRVMSTEAVYHDGLWFRLVHSVETHFNNWNLDTKLLFLDVTGNRQDSYQAELRDIARIDDSAQLYTFRSPSGQYRLIFEWEFGSKPPINFQRLLNSLSSYSSIYNAMRDFSYPPSKLSEQLVRKTVSTVDFIPDNCLYAHKLDGTFGIVVSYHNRIKEKWEDCECVVRNGETLGNGMVFAAERLESGEVFLLDVYQVHGHNTASWCRRSILTEFLPSLNLIPGYFVQTYFSDSQLPNPTVKVDGIICHDVENDVIYKWKQEHSLDLVYVDGYFNLPNKRIKAPRLENGSVYEISVIDGRVIRKRTDRFKGNSQEQIENILKDKKFPP